jgi:hypothetical protein
MTIHGPLISSVLSALLTLATLSPLTLAGCSRATAVAGSGQLKTESRDVRGFTDIQLEGAGQVDLTQTGIDSLTIEAEDNLLPHLTSTVSDGRLHLRVDGAINPTKPIHYIVTVKDLSRIQLDGAGTVTATKIESPSLTVKIDGMGVVSLAGHADALNVSVDGAGNFDASKLSGRWAKVTLNGVGSGEVAASETVDARLDGLGSLGYAGDPEVKRSGSGLGAVHKRTN